MITGFERFSGKVRKQVSHILLSTIYGEVQEALGERGRAGRERGTSKGWFLSPLFLSRLRGRLAGNEGIESEMKRAYVGERKGEEGTEWLDSKVLSVWVRLLLSNSNFHSRSSSDQ